MKKVNACTHLHFFTPPSLPKRYPNTQKNPFIIVLEKSLQNKTTVNAKNVQNYKLTYLCLWHINLKCSLYTARRPEKSRYHRVSNPNATILLGEERENRNEIELLLMDVFTAVKLDQCVLTHYVKGDSGRHHEYADKPIGNSETHHKQICYGP